MQREEAYTEMVLAAAAQLQREADQREAAYLQSVRAAQAAVQEREAKYIEFVRAKGANRNTAPITVNVALASGGTSQDKKQITIR